MTSVLSSCGGGGTRSAVRMCERKKTDERRTKLKRNLIGLVVSRCVQGRVDIPHPTAQQLQEVEEEVDARLDTGPVSDSHVCQMASKLRRRLLANGYRSESAPVGNDLQQTSESNRKTSLPPIENSSIPLNIEAEVTSPVQSSLMRDTMTVYHSKKPAVIKRRENLISDQKWHEVIATDMERYQQEVRNHKNNQKKKMEECRRSLDSQVQLNAQMRRDRKSQESSFARQELARRNHLQSEEQMKQQRKRDELQRQKEARDRQVALERSAKEEQTLNEKREEARYRNELAAEHNEQVTNDKLRKMKNTQDYKQHMQFNIMELTNKKALIDSERQRDKEILLEHAALLEKQERSREAILRRSEKKTPGNQCYTVLHEEKLQKLRLEEERVEREVQQMDLKRNAVETQRASIAKNRKQEFITTLEKQLQSKAEERRNARKQEEDFRRTQDEEVKNSLQLELDAKHLKKQAARSNLKHLDQQVEEKHKRNMGDLQVGIARS